MTPEYPVVGGTALRVPAINSPNFNLEEPAQSPEPSWAILQNGLAYFFGLAITGGLLTSPDLLVYDGTPASGNLVFSVTATAFTDSEGNAVGQGAVSYGEPGTSVSLDGAVLVFTNGESASPTQVIVLPNPSGNGVIVSSNGANPAEWTFGLPIVAEGTLATPNIITTDAGTAAASFGTDWAASGAGVSGVVFTLGPDQWVDVLIDVRTTGAAPAGEICAIPAAYQPAYQPSGGFVVGTLMSGTNSYPLTVTGTLLEQGSVPATSGIRYYGKARYPLGNVP